MARQSLVRVCCAVATILVLPRVGVGQQSPPPRLDTIFAGFAGGESPGCAVAAEKPGMRFEKAYGLADVERRVGNTPATIFEAGSASKQFTAAAVVRLAETGKLGLDDDIRKYIPEVPAFGGRTITIRQLLNHTSGLRDWGVIAALQGWPRETRAYTNAHVLEIVTHQQQLNFDPGTEWSYSNSNYNLAAILVQRVSGLSLAEYTRQEFFEPLGMSHTSWRDDYTRIVTGRALAYARRGDRLVTAMPNESAYGNGGLLTTVGDLLIWNAALDSGRVLGRPLVAELEREGRLANGKPTGYGAGLFLERWRDTREVAHAGATAGYRAYLARYPERHVSVAVLCNAGTANPTVLAHAVADLLLGDVARQATKPTAAAGRAAPRRRVLPRTELERLTGVYRGRHSMAPYPLTASDSGLQLGRLTLVPTGRSEFRAPANPDTRLLFLPPAGAGGTRSPALLIAGTDTTFLDPVASPDTSASRLNDYAGRWYSEEADVTWTLAVEDGRLVAKLPPTTRVPLRPVYADGFAMGGSAAWVFDRGPDGRITGLGVWSERARDLRLRRLP